MSARARHHRSSIASWVARGCIACLLASVLGRALEPSIARAADAPTSDLDEARKHYARGVQLYNEGADAAALAELERAYRLAPNWKVLYDLGLVELQMHDFASALRSFTQYIAEGGAQVAQARRTEVEGRIAQLQKNVAILEVTVNVAGAEILLDDTVVGVSPLAQPLVVNTGHHKLGASKEDRHAEAKLVSVAGADRLSVELTIDTQAQPPAAPANASPELPAANAANAASAASQAGAITVTSARTAETPDNSAKRGVWVAWAGAGALAAGAAAFGIAALHDNSDLAHMRTNGPASGEALEHLSSETRSFALTSDILAGTTLIAAGAALFLTLRASHAAKTKTTPATDVAVRIGPANVSVYGSF